MQFVFVLLEFSLFKLTFNDNKQYIRMELELDRGFTFVPIH
jgi:hypothetical protein